jgi:hypothetical protein
MLSAATTHNINLSSNFIKANVRNVAERPARAGLDAVMGAVRGFVKRPDSRIAGAVGGAVSERATVMIPPTVGAKALKPGAKRGWQALKGLGVENALQRIDMPRETSYFGVKPLEKFKDKPVRWTADRGIKMIFRSLLGGDQLFRTPGEMEDLVEMAIIKARREGLTPRSDKYVERVQYLIENPTLDMVIRSEKAGNAAVFLDPDEYGRQVIQFIGKGKRSIHLKKKPGETPLGQLARGAPGVFTETQIPFVNTLVGIVDEGIDWTGFGMGRALPDLFRWARGVSKLNKVPAEQRAILDATLDELQHEITKHGARGVLGFLGPFAAGYLMWHADAITTTYPEDARERAMWDIEERRENSLLGPDGKWRQVDFLGPYMIATMIGATVAEAFATPSEERWERTSKILGSLFQVVGDMTIAQGIQRVGDLFSGGRTFGKGAEKMLEGYGRMAVPSVVGAVERILDPTERKAEGPIEAARSRIPGAAEGLPPQVSALGDELSRSTGPLPQRIWSNLFSTSRGARKDKRKSDPVIRELSRLNTAPIPPSRTVKYRVEEGAVQQSYTLQSHEYARALKVYGERMRFATEWQIQQEEYREADDMRKVEILEELWKNEKSAITEQLRNELIVRTGP